MIILTDFFYSDVWEGISSRVIATFGFSGIATVANAIPATITTEVATTSIFVDIIQLLTIVSYVCSILVAITILYRFICWYKEKKQKK